MEQRQRQVLHHVEQDEHDQERVAVDVERVQPLHLLVHAVQAWRGWGNGIVNCVLLIIIIIMQRARK